jgi:hypothetical protein
MKEVWKEINGFNGKYYVSNKGKVLSTNKNKRIILKPSTTTGYEYVCLSLNKINKSFKVHRLVANAFILNENNKPFVNHINGIKTDNNVENLEWVTAKENLLHARKTGLNKSYGIYHPKSKLTKEDIINIRESTLKQKELSKIYNIGADGISRIKNYKRYSSV